MNIPPLAAGDAPDVTDASLTILIASHSHMRHLCNLSGVQGTFMSTLLRVAKQLQSLELYDMPAMSWRCGWFFAR